MTDKISMDFKDADIREIFRIITKQAGFGVVIEKSVRGNMTLSLKDVSAKDAMDLVAESSGFAWIKRGNSILLTDEARLGKEVKVINLKYISAEELAKILSMVITADIRVASSDDRASVIIKGGREAIDQAMLIVGRIDKPQKYVKASLKIVHGKTVFHKFDFSARVGESVELKEHLKLAPALVGDVKMSGLSALNCDIQIKGINGDGSLDAELKMGMTRIDAKSGRESNRKFMGQFQVTRGKTVEVVASSQNSPIEVLFTWEK
ncbi:MAG: hypothetical protein KKB51_10720 [Candidatus Riflebacteria bacterium]|nr:hypothetical protein [Candidatus Riflebacteria bacterium]